MLMDRQEVVVRQHLRLASVVKPSLDVLMPEPPKAAGVFNDSLPLSGYIQATLYNILNSRCLDLIPFSVAQDLVCVVSPRSPKVLPSPPVPLHQKHGCKHAICTSFKIFSLGLLLYTLSSCDGYTCFSLFPSRAGFLLVPRVCQRLVENLNCLLLKFLLPPESVRFISSHPCDFVIVAL